MNEMSMLETLNEYPMAGAMLIALMLVVQQIIKSWKGGNDVSRIEKETNKFARQTSETVNRCSERTGEVMEATADIIRAVEKHLEANEFGHLRTELHGAVQVLEAMAHHKDMHHAALERVDDLCRDIASDLQRTDSRVVHNDILSKINALEHTVEDIKRITIGIAGK